MTNLKIRGRLLTDEERRTLSECLRDAAKQYDDIGSRQGTPDDVAQVLRMRAATARELDYLFETFQITITG